LNNARRPAPWRLALGLLVAMPVLVLLVSYVSAWLVHAMIASGGFPAELVADKGPDRVMRRILLVFLLPVLIVAVRRAGWEGWRDCGFGHPANPFCNARSCVHLVLGLALGLVSLGGIAAVAFGLGALVPDDTTDLSLPALALGSVGTALAVALVEETLARGVLFRVFSRVWGPWIAAAAISAFFAVAHFLQPSEAVFHHGPLGVQGWHIFLSTFTEFLQTRAIGLRVLSLFLMSLVLCALVWRTGTIWAAVGAHAAWVWVHRLNHERTCDDPASPFASWFGMRSDHTDSPVAVFTLGALLILILGVRRTSRRNPSS